MKMIMSSVSMGISRSFSIGQCESFHRPYPFIGSFPKISWSSRKRCRRLQEYFSCNGDRFCSVPRMDWYE